MKVLVVEKCKVVRQAIVEALADLDAIAVQGAVPDLRTAVHAIETSAPDVVVTGVQLVDGTALELIEVARTNASAPRIVVVAPAATRDEWRRHLAAGADRFVERDTDLRELRDVVGSLAVKEDGREYELRQLLAGVRASVERASRMTESVLAFVRNEPPRLELLDLGLVVRSALARVLPSLPPTIAVRSEIAEHAPAIYGSHGELELLVLSLALDAVDAMPDGGMLGVRVQPTGAAAVFLEVSHRGSSHDGGGELDLAHRIVERHAGSIRRAPRELGYIAVTVLLPTAEA